MTEERAQEPRGIETPNGSNLASRSAPLVSYGSLLVSLRYLPFTRYAPGSVLRPSGAARRMVNGRIERE